MCTFLSKEQCQYGGEFFMQKQQKQNKKQKKKKKKKRGRKSTWLWSLPFAIFLPLSSCLSFLTKLHWKKLPNDFLDLVNRDAAMSGKNKLARTCQLPLTWPQKIVLTCSAQITPQLGKNEPMPKTQQICQWCNGLVFGSAGTIEWWRQGSCKAK